MSVGEEKPWQPDFGKTAGSTSFFIFIMEFIKTHYVRIRFFRKLRPLFVCVAAHPLFWRNRGREALLPTRHSDVSITLEALLACTLSFGLIFLMFMFE